MAYRWLSKVMPNGGRVRREPQLGRDARSRRDPRLVRTEATPTPSVWDSLEQLVEPGSGYLPEAFDQGLDGLCAAIAKATRSEQSWQGRIDAGAAALLSFLEAHGDWARLVALEAPLSGAATAAVHREVARSSAAGPRAGPRERDRRRQDQTAEPAARRACRARLAVLDPRTDAERRGAARSQSSARRSALRSSRPIWAGPRRAPR